MEIGVSTACFYPANTEDSIKEIQKTGARCIEVFLQASSEYDQAFCKDLKKRIDDAGLRVVSVHGLVSRYEPFLFSEYQRRAKDALLDYQNLTCAGAYLGAKYLSFHGNRIECYKENFDFAAFARVMHTLCDIASENGILLAWENVSWCQSGSPAFLKNSFQYLDKQRLGFTLDLKQALRAKQSYTTYLELFGDRLVNVHISDHTAQNTCVLPGRGETDFCDVFRSLRRAGYDQTCMLEVYQDAFEKTEEIIQAVAFLNEAVQNSKQ